MPRPAKRFVIRRLSIGSPSKLPWCVSDSTRSAYVGRFATWREARSATVGNPSVLLRLLSTENRLRGERDGMPPGVYPR